MCPRNAGPLQEPMGANPDKSSGACQGARKGASPAGLQVGVGREGGCQPTEGLEGAPLAAACPSNRRQISARIPLACSGHWRFGVPSYRAPHCVSHPPGWRELERLAPDHRATGGQGAPGCLTTRPFAYYEVLTGPARPARVEEALQIYRQSLRSAAWADDGLR